MAARVWPDPGAGGGIDTGSIDARPYASSDLGYEGNLLEMPV